jgi:hypothetical protein
MKWAAAVLFALFILLVIILADMGQLGVFGFLNRIPYGDKVGHFLLYGILTLLIDLSLFRSLPSQSRNGMVCYLLPFLSFAALINPANNGCGFIGRDRNSGWNWLAIMKG